MDIVLDTDATARPMATELRHAFAELDLVCRRRELLFSTIAMTLAVIVLVAMSVAFVVSLIQGSTLDPAGMAVGTGITGASVGVRSLGLMRRLSAECITVDDEQ